LELVAILENVLIVADQVDELVELLVELLDADEARLL